MTFKLSPEDTATALNLKGVEPFEPMSALAEEAWEFLS